MGKLGGLRQLIGVVADVTQPLATAITLSKLTVAGANRQSSARLVSCPTRTAFFVESTKPMRELNQRFTTRKSLRLVLAIGVLAASAVAIYQQSKRNQPAANQAAIPTDPNAIQITVSKASGSPCQVTVEGGTQDMRHKMSIHLGDGKTQSEAINFPGPTYTLDSVTVARGDDSKPHELKTTLHATEVYELRIGGDDSIELVPISK